VRLSKSLAAAGVVALVGGMAASGIAGMAAAIAVSGTVRSWVIQPTRNPGGHQGSLLNAVSCPSARTCIAVGGYAPTSRAIVTLAERWNGTKWAVQHMPRVKDTALFGVSCSSARACTAVGYGRKGTLAERWNGRKWVVQRTPNPSGAKRSELVAVSCPAAKACTAVGSYGKNTLAEHWNGTKWAIQATPNPVIGTKGAEGSELLAVSCSSATSCTAVGDSNLTDSRSDTLAEHWNGTTWAIQAAPKPPSGHEPELTGVSCPSATACTAVGNYGPKDATLTLAERWNGATWVIQPTPSPSGTKNPSGDESELTGVSCPSATTCIAAGDYYNRSGTQATLAERWNGATWTLQTTTNPSGAKLSILTEVSCSSARACTAVGDYLSKSWVQLTLSERYS
jgi:hypothetical protein